MRFSLYGNVPTDTNTWRYKKKTYRNMWLEIKFLRILEQNILVEIWKLFCKSRDSVSFLTHTYKNIGFSQKKKWNCKKQIFSTFFFIYIFTIVVKIKSTTLDKDIKKKKDNAKRF